jgi:hypothetical protein
MVSCQTPAHAMAEGDPISDTSDAFVDILNSLWRTNCCEEISDESPVLLFIY